jgi:hypothetical protein
MLSAAEKAVWNAKILMGNFTDEELTTFVRTHLISDEDLAFLHERNWTIVDVLMGQNQLSKDISEAEEEVRRLAKMFSEWDEYLESTSFLDVTCDHLG